jgi:hypothetical protein
MFIVKKIRTEDKKLKIKESSQNPTTKQYHNMDKNTLPKLNNNNNKHLDNHMNERQMINEWALQKNLFTNILEEMNNSKAGLINFDRYQPKYFNNIEENVDDFITNDSNTSFYDKIMEKFKKENNSNKKKKDIIKKKEKKENLQKKQNLNNNDYSNHSIDNKYDSVKHNSFNGNISPIRLHINKKQNNNFISNNSPKDKDKKSLFSKKDFVLDVKNTETKSPKMLKYIKHSANVNEISNINNNINQSNYYNENEKKTGVVGSIYLDKLDPKRKVSHQNLLHSKKSGKSIKFSQQLDNSIINHLAFNKNKSSKVLDYIEDLSINKKEKSKFRLFCCF